MNRVFTKKIYLNVEKWITINLERCNPASNSGVVQNTFSDQK